MVSVDGGARYLSPVAQLIGASSDAIGIRDSIRESERKIRQGTWVTPVFDEAAKLNVTALSGRYMDQSGSDCAIGFDARRARWGSHTRSARANCIEAEVSVFRGRYAIGYTMLRMPPERGLRAPDRRFWPMLSAAY